jgi:AcrR family transcriptional regulator
MGKKKIQKRKYDSKRRQEQARITRKQILKSALKLFSDYGYAGATVEAIAQEAGVASVTIYSIFGNKRSILAGLIDISVGGDDQPIPILQRPGPQSVFKEKDQVNQIHKFAVDIANILERVAPVFEIMRIAAKTEPEIAEMLHTILEERLSNLSVFVQHVAANGRLREGLDGFHAAETVWTIASPEVFQLLTVEREWSKEQFSEWLGDTLTRLLLTTSSK